MSSYELQVQGSGSLLRSLEEHSVSPQVLCETSQTDVIAQLTGEGLAIGFASSSIAERNCPVTCRAIPLADEIRRSIYYITLNELLDYPTIESFTGCVRHFRME